MQSHRRAHPRPALHLSGVAELFRDGARGGRLLELAKAGARVGKSPAGQLDLEPVERGVDDLALSIGSHVLRSLRSNDATDMKKTKVSFQIAKRIFRRDVR